ncbi:murein biosynthesis integral membrane protein MurJ [bacterium]|nr:murein biosynthesis integral membrane protein MurJ [bacterium]
MSSVKKNALIATFAVFFSRIAGLIREMVFAFFFGAGPALDAFITAFRIPNLLRDLFAEGALSQSFVSVFSKKMVTDGDEAAFRLASRLKIFVLIFLGIICALGIIFAPQIVTLLASGFSPEKRELTIQLTRVLFPFILFVSLAAVCMGMLNAKGKFGLPQSASTFFNISSIIAGLFFSFLLSPQMMTSSFKYLVQGGDKPVYAAFEIVQAILGMAIGTLLGGLVQWIIQVPLLFKLGFRFHFPRPLFDDNLKKVLLLTLPSIVGASAVQVNVLINTNFASYLADGSISWLSYAFRFMQFPIGLFGVAVSLATAPALARLLAQGKEGELRQTLKGSIQMTLFLCVPSALGLMVFAKPIISLIYQYGHFTDYDAYQTALALKAYAMGLGFYALIKVYQPAFLAFDDAKLPMRVSLISIAVNFVLGYLMVFYFHFSHWGLALSTSLVASINFALLAFFFKKKASDVWDNELIATTFKIILASAVSVGAGFALQLVLPHGRLFVPLVPILLTSLVYMAISNALRLEEATALMQSIKRKIRL